MNDLLAQQNAKESSYSIPNETLHNITLLLY